MNQGNTNLTEQEKNQLINKYRNFPTLPTNIEGVGSKSQRQILYENFPWGCSRLQQDFIRFNNQDQLTHLTYSNDFSLANLLIGIKYGICSNNRIEKLKEIKQKLQNARKNNGNLYLILKLYDKMTDRHKTLALARVTDVNLHTSFRFWSIPSGNKYPLGIIMIETIAVGQIDSNDKKLVHIFTDLRRSILEWKYFRVAEDFEWNQRKKYIQAIKQNRYEILQKQLKNKHLSILKLDNSSMI